MKIFVYSKISEKGINKKLKLLFANKHVEYVNRNFLNYIDEYETLENRFSEKNINCKLKEVLSYAETIIDILYKSLNVIHGTSYTKSYWRIVLGHFLIYHIDIYYKIFQEINQIEDRNVGSYLSEITNVSYNESSYIEKIVSSEIQNIIYSDILKKKGFFIVSSIEQEKNNELNNDENCFREGSQAKTSKFKKIIGKCRRVFKRLLVKIIEKTVKNDSKIETYIYNYPASEELLSLTIKSLGKIRAYRQKNYNRKIAKLECDNKIRDRFKNIAIALYNSNIEKNDFLEVFFENIAQYMPIEFLEEYKLINERVIDEIKIIPRKILTDYGIYNTDISKYHIAYCKEKGSKLLLNEHAGFGGDILEDFINVFFEEKACDRIYTFGTGPTALRIIKHKLALEKRTREDSLLFVANTNWASKMAGYGIFLEVCDAITYLNKEIKILNMLEESKFKIIYRDRWFRGQMIDSFKYIKENCNFIVRDENRPIVESINAAKLVIIDFLSTSILDTLLLNKPLIIYFDLTKVLINDKGKEAFELLKKVGIFFDNPEDAAKKVIEIYDDPRKWWFSEDIQTARKYMCDNFIHYSENWQDEWLEELLKEN